jgi:hypothetical protein
MHNLETYLHSIEYLAIKFPSPFLRSITITELEKSKIPVHLRRHNHPAMNDVASPLLSHEAKKVTR